MNAILKRSITLSAAFCLLVSQTSMASQRSSDLVIGNERIHSIAGEKGSKKVILKVENLSQSGRNIRFLVCNSQEVFNANNLVQTESFVRQARANCRDIIPQSELANGRGQSYSDAEIKQVTSDALRNVFLKTIASGASLIAASVFVLKFLFLAGLGGLLGEATVWIIPLLQALDIGGFAIVFTGTVGGAHVLTASSTNWGPVTDLLNVGNPLESGAQRELLKTNDELLSGNGKVQAIDVDGMMDIDSAERTLAGVLGDILEKR